MKKTVKTSVEQPATNRTLKAIGADFKVKWGLPVVLAPLMLQALVEPLHQVEEGFIIKILEPAWRQIRDALQRDPNALSTLSPRQWEELVAASYDKAGFDEVILTPRSGDFGRDVIAIRKGWGSVRIIDQVKAFSLGHVVTANDVRALLGVLGADRNATKGVVTTTSTFAPRITVDPSIVPYLPYRLELIDGQMLAERLSRLAAQP